MKDTQRFKAEMFMRVSELGVNQGAIFSLASLGGRLFADLSALIIDINSQAAKQSSGLSSAEQGTTTKSEARENLSEDLEAISRTARAAAEEIPGVSDKFRRPSASISDQGLIAVANAAAADAPPFQAKFVEYGLPADFLEDLLADIIAFQAAINAQATGRRQHVTATAALDELIERGMVIVRRLDAIVRNTFRDDPAMLAAWVSARHVERSPRRRKEPTPQPPPQQ